MAEEKLEGNELALQVFAPAPSMLFEMSRYLDDGSEKKIPVRIKLLRADETIAAIVEAQKDAKRIGELKEYGDVYRECQGYSMLARCVVQPELSSRADGTQSYARLFVSADQARMRLTETEAAQLLNMYQVVKSKFGGLEDFSEDGFEELVRNLADPLRGAFFLSALDSLAWPKLIFRLAVALNGYLPPGSPDTSESDPENSDPGTGPSSSLPSAQSEAGLKMPEDKIWTAQQAKSALTAFERDKPDDE